MAKKKTTSKKSTAKPSKPITLRPYQMDCEDTIERAGDGRHLVVLAMDLLARNKSRSDAQVDEEGRFFEINLSFAPQKIAATPKQVSYAIA